MEVGWQEECGRRGMPPMGLKNLGNTCYLNSVLQCLTYTPPLASFCLQRTHSRQCTSGEDGGGVCPFCLLENRVNASLNEPSTVGSPGRIYKCLLDYAKNFRHGRQEDAHEFLRYAVDACDNVLKMPMKSETTAVVPTVMKDIFGGTVQSQIRCLACNSHSCTLDATMDLPLDVRNANNLKDALGKFFQPELLDGNNKYQCETCKRLTVARKQMFVYEAPNVLVVVLKRFENAFGGKIDRHLKFEEKLTLAPYMHASSKDLYPEYNLYAQVVHSGFTQYGGHYYAYVKDSWGKWFRCNDAFVSAVDCSAVLAEKVYILFYIRASGGAAKGPSSTTSTPSPPSTPDPVVTVKPSTSGAVLSKVQQPKPECAAKERPQLRFQIHNPAKTKPLAVKSVLAQAQADDKVAPSVVPLQASKRQREDSSVRLEAVYGELKQLRESKKLLDFRTRLEKDTRDALQQSSWCDESRELLRAAKRCRLSKGLPVDVRLLIQDMREALVRKLPVSVKEQKLNELGSFFGSEGF